MNIIAGTTGFQDADIFYQSIPETLSRWEEKMSFWIRNQLLKVVTRVARYHLR